GFIVTANNNILPAGYPRPINYSWAEPFRADRLAGVLRDSGSFTRADFERLHHDELSLPARTLVPVLLAAGQRRFGAERAAPSAGSRNDVEAALTTLSSWD